MEQHQAGDDQLLVRLVIQPAPTTTERDAIVAALSVLGMMASHAGSEETVAGVARPWLEMGRRESVRGLRGGSLTGWGRSRRAAG